MFCCDTAGFAVPPHISEHSVSEKVHDRSRNTRLGEGSEARAGFLPDPAGAWSLFLVFSLPVALPRRLFTPHPTVTSCSLLAVH